ncbi:hypothetical protein Zmor_012622 [Zophobas morio]|uniref:Uncharacterized protein n=1 Tax=Zophobas morio TaxID=2755281 RepID=A0AA38IGB5_9CUCU|nr:hypothetical protein Zmor_012622 [Zophobas morio]
MRPTLPILIATTGDATNDECNGPRLCTEISYPRSQLPLFTHILVPLQFPRSTLVIASSSALLYRNRSATICTSASLFLLAYLGAA